MVLVVLAGEDVLEPWGSSWLWVPAILGPVIGARTLLKQDEPRPLLPDEANINCG